MWLQSSLKHCLLFIDTWGALMPRFFVLSVTGGTISECCFQHLGDFTGDEEPSTISFLYLYFLCLLVHWVKMVCHWEDRSLVGPRAVSSIAKWFQRAEWVRWLAHCHSELGMMMRQREESGTLLRYPLLHVRSQTHSTRCPVWLSCELWRNEHHNTLLHLKLSNGDSIISLYCALILHVCTEYRFQCTCLMNKLAARFWGDTVSVQVI